MSALYLYAIVDRRPAASLGRGLARELLSVVRAAGIFVVVGRAGAAPASAANLRAHDRAVRRIARACSAVLPFRFGSVVADRAALTALLAPIAPHVPGALERVRDSVELTLRIYGQASPPPRPARGAGPGTRFLHARLRQSQVPEIATVTSALAPFVRASRVERHDRPPLIASVYHLVRSTDVRRYRAALASSARALDRVRVESTGPWPPYAFAEVP